MDQRLIRYSYDMQLATGRSYIFEDLDKMLRFWRFGRLICIDDGFLTIELTEGLCEEEVLAAIGHWMRTTPSVAEQTIFCNALAPLAPILDGCLKVETSPGVFAYDASYEQHASKVRLLLHDILGAKFSYSTYKLPSLIEERFLKVAGYLDNFGSAVLPVSSFQSSYWETAAGRAPVRRDGDHALCLNPAACLQFWSNFDALQSQSSNIALIEGKVFRNEGGGHSATRLREFDMLEVVGWGDVSTCQILFESFTDVFKEVMKRIGCPFAISTASDSFVGADSKLKQTSQLRLGQKREFRVPLGNTELTVASVNYHADKFCGGFEFGSEDIQATCCAGIGLQRAAQVIETLGAGV